MMLQFACGWHDCSSTLVYRREKRGAYRLFVTFVSQSNYIVLLYCLPIRFISFFFLNWQRFLTSSIFFSRCRIGLGCFFWLSLSSFKPGRLHSSLCRQALECTWCRHHCQALECKQSHHHCQALEKYTQSQSQSYHHHHH